MARKGSADKKKMIRRRYAFILALILIISFLLRLYPAIINEFPKGSDTFFHMRIANDIREKGSLVIHDSYTGAINTYPPFFHLMLALLFYLFDPMIVAKLFGPLLGFASVIAFFFFAKGIYGTRIALGAAFVYGTATEMINTALFTFPENIGFALIFLSLYEFRRYERSIRSIHLYTSAFIAVLLALTHTISFVMLVVFFFVFFKDAKKIGRVIAPSLVVFVAWFFWLHYLGATTFIMQKYINADYIFFAFSPAFFALALLGMQNAPRRLAFSYIIFMAAIIFMPFYPERILTFSIVIGAILAAHGADIILRQKSCTKIAVIALIIAIAMLQAVEIGNAFGYAKSEMRHEDYEILTWARENLPRDAVITGSWQVSGEWIKTIAKRKTILGAFHESIRDYDARRRDLEKIFLSSDRETIIDTTMRYGSEYIFINVYENNALYAGAIERLKSIFPVEISNGYAYIFRVV